MTLSDFWRNESSRFDALLFDIDGTVILGKHALPGVAEFLAMLRRSNTPFWFLTNDGNHTRKEKCRFLSRAGIKAGENEIISCLSVLPDLVKRNDWCNELFFQVGFLGDTQNIQLTTDLDRLGECYGVLMGEGTYDWRTTWEALTSYFRRYPDRPFIVPNPDTCWPSASTGGIGIGAGGQARCLQLLLKEMGVNITPVYLGKPYEEIYNYAVRQLGEIERKRILCVGDSLSSDILGANNAGMFSALVLTGITTRRQAEEAKRESCPQVIFETFNT
ncbi:MAG: HAD-IIA family hydrolase [Victivallales bacterium]|jgi:HAD superfamily hydrolase (TIGR01450 family)|nr:HAD-IIA family hydrolase [Victivallales bacterium]